MKLAMEIGNLLLKKEHRLRLTTVTDTSVTRYIFVGIGILKLVSEKNGLFLAKAGQYYNLHDL